MACFSSFWEFFLSKVDGGCTSDQRPTPQHKLEAATGSKVFGCKID